MPSEKALLKQAGLAREALKTFMVVHKLGVPNVIRPALVDLINYTVCLALMPILSKVFITFVC